MNNSRETKTFYDPLVKWIHKQCENSGWLNHMDCPDPSMIGVVLKSQVGGTSIYPPWLNTTITEATESLNASVIITMVSEVTAVLFDQLSPFQHEITLHPSGLSIPIVECFEDVRQLSTSKQPERTACLVRKYGILLVWTAAVENILPQARELEKLLREELSLPIATTGPGSRTSQLHTPTQTPRGTKSPMDNHFNLAELTSGFAGKYASAFSERAWADNKSGVHMMTDPEKEEEEEVEVYDPEKDAGGPPSRPMILTHSFMVGLGMAALVTIQMGGVAQLVGEICVDGNYYRLLYLLMVPLSSTLALFFFTTMVACLFQFFGPVGDCKGNSRYHSAIAPDLSTHQDTELPHITIQMPVYKEGLSGVLDPTIRSIKAAIKHYEQVGGTASIFVNEDGMQVISPELAAARRLFYARNNVGWCARPPHNKDGFLRKGQFKKASNMNYCLDFSIRVEDELQRRLDICAANNPGEEITVAKENELYEAAMELVIASDEGRTWAAGNVRLGEFILLVDCDTRVPVDCLRLGALEMMESPDVAIIQHASGVMQVVHNLFENAITYLTNMIYISIEYACGSGDLACFVGHNAFLRWKAIQSVAFQEDGKTKFWSDSHVSEDFDQALRLQIAGFIIRLATYHNGEFKEGVSLTVFDELARWEKYTYGCNELLFNPLHKWIYRGPFTPLLWRLLTSNVKSSSKVTILGYVFTYYAMAAALPFTVINYFLMGWIPDYLDHYYLDSFRMMVLLLIVFNLVSPIAYNFLLHRLQKTPFHIGLFRTIKWMPLFMCFFGGLSIHLSKAIICHFFSINMEWNSTAKELEATGFFIGMDKIVKDFKYMYIIVISLAAGMVYLAIWAPTGWMVKDYTMILPVANQLVCHFFLPLALGLF